MRSRKFTGEREDGICGVWKLYRERKKNLARLKAQTNTKTNQIKSNELERSPVPAIFCPWMYPMDYGA